MSNSSMSFMKMAVSQEIAHSISIVIGRLWQSDACNVLLVKTSKLKYYSIDLYSCIMFLAISDIIG